MPRTRKPANFRQLTAFEREWIVSLREAGCSFRDIATPINRNLNTVVCCYQIWLQEGWTSRARPTGARRRITNREDRRLRLLSLRDRFTSTRAIAGRWVTERVNLIGSLVCEPFIAEFEVLNWSYTVLIQWNSVVFNDESRLCLGMHDGRASVRRRRGERCNPQFCVERHVHHTVGIMVWGAITNEIGLLCFFSRPPKSSFSTR